METTSSIEIPEQHLPAKIISIKVKKDQQIDKNTVICLYEISKDNPETNKLNSFEKNNIEELRSSVLGKIEEVNIEIGQVISTKNFPILKIIEPCSHAVQWKGMCSLCGKDCSIDDFAGSDSSRATIRMTHDASELFVSQQEAQRLEKENATRLITQKKLSLILDLDQTIIHATIDPTIGEWQNDSNNPNYEALKDVHHFVLPDSATIYYIKLRPGVREFLKEINQYYELHIYTMGTRSYANAIAKIIDPTSEYFGNRILSRDESGSFALKSIQRLFPCDQSMVVVIDDRADVWCWSENLIKVQPYNFFVGIGDINNTALLLEQEMNKQRKIEEKIDSETKDIKGNNENGDDKKVNINNTTNIDKNKEDKKEEYKDKNDNNNTKSITEQATNSKNTILIDNDHELEVVKRVLKDIHKKFYTSYDSKEKDVSVQNIMTNMRHKVLDGKNILFSSVIPLNQDPYSTDIWNLTIMFGGHPYTQIVPNLTHVVAGKNGTTKVNQARKIPGIKIVKPEWLLQSIYNWKLEDEEKYLLDPNSTLNDDDSKMFDFLDNNDNANLSSNYNSIGGDILTEDEKMINDIMTEPLINLNDLSHEWDSMDMEIDEAIGDSEYGNDDDGFTNDSEVPSDDDNNDNIADPNYSLDDHTEDDNDDEDSNVNSKIKVTNMSKHGDVQFNLEDYENDEGFKKTKMRKRKRPSNKTEDSNNSNNDEEDELDTSSDESNDDDDDNNNHIKKKHHNNNNDDNENDDDDNENDDDDDDDDNDDDVGDEDDGDDEDDDEDSSQSANEDSEDVSQSAYSESDTNSGIYSEDNDEETNDLEAELEAMVENDDDSINSSIENEEKDDDNNDNDNDNDIDKNDNDSISENNNKKTTVVEGDSDNQNNEESEGGIDSFEEIGSEDFNDNENDNEEIQDDDDDDDE